MHHIHHRDSPDQYNSVRAVNKYIDRTILISTLTLAYFQAVTRITLHRLSLDPRIQRVYFVGCRRPDSFANPVNRRRSRQERAELNAESFMSSFCLFRSVAEAKVTFPVQFTIYTLYTFCL